MPNEEKENILKHCHSLECGGHFGSTRTVTKYSKTDSIGLLYSKMRMHMTNVVICIGGPPTPTLADEGDARLYWDSLLPFSDIGGPKPYN